MKQGTNLHVYTWSRTVRLGGFAPARPQCSAFTSILAAWVLHTSDVRTNICYGNVMTHMKTWNLIGSSAYKLIIP